jgi:putative transposase
MKKLQIPLEQGKFYHIFNRGNNGDNMFYNAENYRFFLRRLDEYLSSFIEVYAYSLMPNHFHLLARVKETGEEALLFKKAKLLNDNQKALHLQDAMLLKSIDPVSKAFHRFFTSYSKAINLQEGRHGSLIENPFKRKEVADTKYFANLIFYIHANPQLHGICDDFMQYPWSSYNRIISGKPSKLKKDEVLKWFNDPENFIAFHSQRIDIEIIKDLLFE